MSNKYIKAAEEARKFLKSIENLVAVADELENAGHIEQVKAETEREITRNRTILSGLLDDITQARTDAAMVADEAKRSADEVTTAAAESAVRLISGAKADVAALIEGEAAEEIADLRNEVANGKDANDLLRADRDGANEKIAELTASLAASEGKLEIARAAMDNAFKQTAGK